MMGDSWWIAEIDHRISTALIFFLLLLLLGRRAKRSHFPVRAGLSLAAMCTASWLMRFCIDHFLPTVPLQGLGYSLHIFVMSALFLGSYCFCYKNPFTDTLYANMLALTIYKLAWNTFKAASTGFLTLGVSSVWGNYSVMGSVISYLTYAAVSVIAWFIYHRVYDGEPMELPPFSRSVVVSVIAFMGAMMMLEYCGHVLTASVQTEFLFYICALMYTITNFLILLDFLRLNHFRRDNADLRAFIDNKQRYYQISRDGITSLQVKCHDLKHQIAAIRSQAGRTDFDRRLTELEDIINEYGTVADCGNEALNIVLTEKNVLCSSGHVKFTYVIDGTQFDFLSEMEIFSLFGNALDNALESCAKIEDPAKRLIFLKGGKRDGMVILHVENSCDEPPVMVDGIPQTSKSGSGHGFGVRSIRQVAEKYNGFISMCAEHGLFKLTVIMKP